MYNKERIAAVILTYSSVIGTISTAILSSVASKKCEKGKITKEKIKKDLPKYIPTIIVGSITIASIISSNIISRKTEASLTATVLAISQGYKKYKEKIVEKIGEEENKKIIKEIDDETVIKKEKDDGTKLYHNEYIGFFKAKPEKIIEAIYNMNMRITARNIFGFEKPYEEGWCSLGQFIKESEAYVYNKDKAFVIKDFGWNDVYLAEEVEDTWIYYDFSDTPDKITKNGEKYIELTFRTADPIYGPMDIYEERHIWKNIEEKGE